MSVQDLKVYFEFSEKCEVHYSTGTNEDEGCTLDSILYKGVDIIALISGEQLNELAKEVDDLDTPLMRAVEKSEYEEER